MSAETCILHEVVNVLKEFTLDEVLEFEEKYDPQFLALKRLYNRIRESDIFVALVCLNALVCYQLNCRGEEYWWEFSDFFVSNKLCCSQILKSILDFLQQSKCNRRLLSQKVRRVKKAYVVVRRYSSKIDWLIENQARFAERISGMLNTRKNAKTIVFTIKMLNYSLRIITNKKIVAPFELDIPLDNRIKRISDGLGIKSPIDFWRRVSRIINIPPLHIDSLLWLSYRMKDMKNSFCDQKIDRLLRFLFHKK